MKWMYRPSVTEMERGGVYEMEIEISSIDFCDTWSVHPFHRHFLYKDVSLQGRTWLGQRGEAGLATVGASLTLALLGRVP